MTSSVLADTTVMVWLELGAIHSPPMNNVSC
jgi:hypothetical protein